MFVVLQPTPDGPFSSQAVALLDAINPKSDPVELITRSGLAQGAILWNPNNRNAQKIHNSQHLVFDWLADRLLASFGGCGQVEVCFMRVHTNGKTTGDYTFTCYIAMPYTPGSEWLVCWKDNCIFSQVDVSCLKTMRRVFMYSGECQSECLCKKDSSLSETHTLMAALDKVSDCVLVCEQDGSLKCCNRTAKQWFGDIASLTSEHKSVNWLASLVHPDDLAMVADSWREAYVNGKEMSIDCKVVVMAGEVIKAKFNFAPINQEQGSSKLWIATLRRVEDFDQEAKVQEARTRFLSEMSYELMTPLSCIIGTCDLLSCASTDTLHPQQLEMISTVSSCSRQLYQQIENILDLRKIDDKKLLLNPQRVIVERLLNEAIQFVSPEIHRKLLDIFLHVSPNVPETILIDEARLKQILVNLIGNAVKFTLPSTMVSIRVSQIDNELIKQKEECKQSETIKLKIEIEDRGPGLSNADHESTLFESYLQLDKSMESKFGGTGLGLAISKRLVNMMEGKIWYEPVYCDLERADIQGKEQAIIGTRFVFTIKACKVNDTLESSSTGKELTVGQAQRTLQDYINMFLNDKPVRILIRTVSKDLVGYLMSMFRVFESKIQVDELNFHDPLANQHSSIWIIDEGLLDEYKLCSHDQATVIMLSRNDVQLSRKLQSEGLLGHGMIKVVKRPLFTPLLLRAVFEALVEGQMAENMGNMTGGVSGALALSSSGEYGYNGYTTRLQPAIPLARQCPLRVMIVDDNAINVQLMEKILFKFGYTDLVKCSSGKQALEALFTTNNSKKVDCIFMDTEMPVMGGGEATRQIRLMHISVHVIALTARCGDDDDLYNQDKNAMMCRQMRKPIKWDQLEQELRLAWSVKMGVADCVCCAKGFCTI